MNTLRRRLGTGLAAVSLIAGGLIAFAETSFAASGENLHCTTVTDSNDPGAANLLGTVGLQVPPGTGTGVGCTPGTQFSTGEEAVPNFCASNNLNGVLAVGESGRCAP